MRSYLAVFGYGVARVITVDRPGTIPLEEGHAIEVMPLEGRDIYGKWVTGGVTFSVIRGGERLCGTNLRPNGLVYSRCGYKVANFLSEKDARMWAKGVPE